MEDDERNEIEEERGGKRKEEREGIVKCMFR